MLFSGDSIDNFEQVMNAGWVIFFFFLFIYSFVVHFLNWATCINFSTCYKYTLIRLGYLSGVSVSFYYAANDCV